MSAIYTFLIKCGKARAAAHLDALGYRDLAQKVRLIDD